MPHTGQFANDEQAIDELNKITNDALGISRTVEGGSPLVKAPERPGQPDQKNAQRFEIALADFYNPKALGSMMERESSFFSFPHNLHPLQALLLKECGMALPISSSGRRPLADRELRHIALWAAGNDYYSEMEALCVHEFCSAHNVAVDLYRGSEASLSDFLALYQDQSYDLIHVVGHGHYDHWQFGSSSVMINERELVSVRDLLQVPIVSDGRRILTLNVCDGGASDGLGGVQKLGLASALASPSQAVISHLWPVEPRVAAAFGLTFCDELLTNPADFFGAFSSTLDRIREPWQLRVDTLRDRFKGEILERLAYFTPNETIFDWGSPVFYQ